MATEIELGIYGENCFMCKNIQIKEERISKIEYIEFLKRTDLGSQYPKE